CPACGAPLSPVVPASQPANRWSHIPPAAWIGGLLLALILGFPIYFCFYGSSDWFQTEYPAIYSHRRLAIIIYCAVCYVILDTVSRVASAKHRKANDRN